MSRFVISDIHGCSETFKSLIETIKLSYKDHLYILGDFINKGPDSKGVLDFVFSLQKDGYQVSSLRGNHDQMLLDVQLGNVAGSWLNEEQKIITLKSFSVNSPFDIPKPYINFLDATPFYIELDDYFLVHAGFNFLIKDPLSDKPSMLNSKNFWEFNGKLNGKKTIHGHTPVSLTEIKKNVKDQKDIIAIDGGCVYTDRKDMGNLIALNIDSMEIFVQKNLDNT